MISTGKDRFIFYEGKGNGHQAGRLARIAYDYLPGIEGIRCGNHTHLMPVYWKKYYVNITRFLVTGTNTITFLFESDTATASKIYLDNIAINRIPGANTSFENSSDSWRLTPSGFGSRFVTEEFFDKIYSLRIQAPENKATATLRYTFKK